MTAFWAEMRESWDSLSLLKMTVPACRRKRFPSTRFSASLTALRWIS